jgi:ribose transport system permease protein
MTTGAERPEAEDAPGDERPSAPRLWSIDRGRVLEGSMLPLAWILLIIGFSLGLPGKFLTTANFANIFGSQAVLFVLTMALLVPLTSGDIDLSVGALSGLVSIIIAVLNVQHGVPIVWCCLIGLAVGAGAGLGNGLIAVCFDVDPFIITLASGTVFTGLGEWVSKEQTIVGTSLPLSNWTYLKTLLGIPLEFYYGLVVMLVVWYVLSFTAFGQRALFVGQSRDVARLSGFRVNRIRLQGFVIAGAVSALSGILFIGTNGSASPGSGTTLLLPAYAAAFLGLTTIQPGRFNAWGSGISVFFLASGVAGLELLGAQDYVQELFYGVVLIVAVVISRLVNRRRQAAVHTS